MLHTILLDIKLAENYEREIAYIGELLILFDYRLTDRNKTGIGELLKKHNLLTSTIRGQLLFFNATNVFRHLRHLGHHVSAVRKDVYEGNSVHR